VAVLKVIQVGQHLAFKDFWCSQDTVSTQTPLAPNGGICYRRAANTKGYFKVKMIFRHLEVIAPSITSAIVTEWDRSEVTLIFEQLLVVQTLSFLALSLNSIPSFGMRVPTYHPNPSPGGGGVTSWLTVQYGQGLYLSGFGFGLGGFGFG
jgi:hypothetical protein